MNPNNLHKFFADLGLNARKDIIPINSFTKDMAPPLMNSIFLTQIIETELINILLTNCLLNSHVVKMTCL